MRKNKKAMLVLLSAAMLAGAVSGCSKSSKTEGSIEFTDPNGETPTDEGYGILREASTNKIGSLNPLTYINSYSSTQIKRCSVILYTYFPNEDNTFCTLSGELAAEDPIKMDDEGKVWQIKIREGVTWENGDPLNANDVYYTWQMIQS